MPRVFKTFSMKCRDLNIELPMFTSQAIPVGQQKINEQIRGAFNGVEQEITDIRENMKSVNAVTISMAFQKATITADMLASSLDPLAATVPRSVLTTKSQTAYEFDWWHAGGASPAYTVQLNAGGGVPSIPVVIDPDHMGMLRVEETSVGASAELPARTIARPANAAGTELQFGYYMPDSARDGHWKFWPVSVLVEGSVMYLFEAMPVVTIK